VNQIFVTAETCVLNNVKKAVRSLRAVMDLVPQSWNVEAPGVEQDVMHLQTLKVSLVLYHPHPWSSWFNRYRTFPASMTSLPSLQLRQRLKKAYQYSSSEWRLQTKPYMSCSQV
jgi:hypothetical protein